MSNKKQRTCAYSAIIAHIFFNGYKPGVRNIPFAREEIIAAASKLGVPLPRNIGDVTYAYRYRKALPPEVIKTQPEDLEWIIQGVGDAKYAFKLAPFNRILPNPNLLSIKIPDATPEISGHDQHGVVQTSQDIAWCAQRLPELMCRPVSVQFVTETKIAMFELFDDHGIIKVAEERHYELVPSDCISTDDLKTYGALAKD